MAATRLGYPAHAEKPLVGNPTSMSFMIGCYELHFLRTAKEMSRIL